MPTWEMILKPDRAGTLVPWKAKYEVFSLAILMPEHSLTPRRKVMPVLPSRTFPLLRGMELGAAPGLGRGLEPPRNDQVPRTSEE